MNIENADRRRRRALPQGRQGRTESRMKTPTEFSAKALKAASDHARTLEDLRSHRKSIEKMNNGAHTQTMLDMIRRYASWKQLAEWAILAIDRKTRVEMKKLRGLGVELTDEEASA